MVPSPESRLGGEIASPSSIHVHARERLSPARPVKTSGRDSGRPSSTRRVFVRAREIKTKTTRSGRRRPVPSNAAAVSPWQWHPATPSPGRGGQDLASLGNGNRLLAGSFLRCSSSSVLPGRVRRRRKTSQCVARTRNVSGMCPRVLEADNSKVPICRHFSEAL